jgi:hypothetical protein
MSDSTCWRQLTVLTQGPMLIFDKSTIQSLPVDEVVLLYTE